MSAYRIEDEGALFALLGGPAASVVQRKLSDRLIKETRPFVERAPFLLLATFDRDGRVDVSPRGDPPGFVRVLDDRTLFLPERPGNRLADSLRNILSTGRVGLIFLIPGVADAFRVNGRAELRTDPALLEGCAVEDKMPKLGVLVHIEEALTHCSKAALRSGLWDPSKHQRRGDFATNGQILAALSQDNFDANAYDVERDARYARREGFY